MYSSKFLTAALSQVLKASVLCEGEWEEATKKKKALLK